MSGDVQPRKRKDKKRKKDDLGIEEPRGTAAVLGEGDVFMHSHHEHGTGGHWCAKIIFFSLLAVLITLVGLIILENRGLSELEANSVESRYSGVLEGWLEDAPDDDHHDEHTLELNHHEHDDNTHDENTHDLEDEDDEEMEQTQDDSEEQQDDDEDDHEQYEEEENQQSNEDDLDESDEDDDVLADENDDNENDDEENENSQEQDMENDEDEEDIQEYHYRRQQHESKEYQEIDDNNDNSNEDDNDLEDNENYDDDKSNDQNSIEHESEEDNDYQDEREDDDEHEEDDAGDEDVELERLEKETEELLNEEPISTELPALLEDDDVDDKTNEDDKDEDVSNEDEQGGDDADDGEEDDEYLELDDNEEPIVEHITAPPGKPLVEVEDNAASEQPPDTLAEEEEYEKRQEELRREEEESSHMWLKLTVGGALLVATHAVMRRATRDSQDDEDEIVREGTPLTDRRMTLIADEPSAPVEKTAEEILQPKIDKKLESLFPSTRPTIIKKQESEEEVSEDEDVRETSPTENKELYSDEEEEEIIIGEPKILPKINPPVVENKPVQESEPEDEDPDDVEIIDEEQLEEELEEDDEEEISDVDDAELLTRLEAKYGKLPEPERPGQKHKDGGNNVDDDWPGEPSDTYWRRQLDSAERELHQGEWNAAIAHAGADKLRDSARARWIIARALDQSAETQRDNRLLSRAISAYLNLLKMNERLSDKKLLQVTERTLDRIQFRGTYLNAEPVYRLLIRRFPNDPVYRNNLTIAFLMGNRADLAEDTLKETLKLWPNDRVALAHYGFVLKTSHNRYEDAIKAFEKALEGDTGPATEARFYYHYGDALLLLGRPDDAHQVHKRGAALGHFLSPEQRSLYNVPRLKSKPWWNIEDTPYKRLAIALEKSWKEILKEGEAAKALFEKEKEGLKERGEWSQMDLFVRGQEIPGRCKRAPVTCSVVKSEPAAVGCRRGQIKFSLMAPGTHVRPHVGPTNCRLRMHLGLSNTKDTYIRVDKEIRQWQTGKTFVFDDSFEHEVWHNGTGTRLVLIVDVWHPQLTASERRQLPAI